MKPSFKQVVLLSQAFLGIPHANLFFPRIFQQCAEVSLVSLSRAQVLLSQKGAEL